MKKHAWFASCKNSYKRRKIKVLFKGYSSKEIEDIMKILNDIADRMANVGTITIERND